MIHPSAEALLRTVIETIDKVLRPGLEEKLRHAAPESVSQDKIHLSTVITIRHLLRLVTLRLATDSATMRQEQEKLAPALIAIRTIFSAQPPPPNAPVLEQFLAAEPHSCPPATDANALAGEIGQHRLVLHEALHVLTKHRAVFSAHLEYARCRQTIRDYLAWQLAAESRLIDGAFAGPDFRR